VPQLPVLRRGKEYVRHWFTKFTRRRVPVLSEVRKVVVTWQQCQIAKNALAGMNLVNFIRAKEVLNRENLGANFRRK
jgi:uncharacterized protein YacL (UPF0231 family)